LLMQGKLCCQRAVALSPQDTTTFVWYMAWTIIDLGLRRVLWGLTGV